MKVPMTRGKRLINYLNRNWLVLFSLSFGFYVGLPFLAPLLMHIGWEGPAKGIYLVYSFLCHQLPQRSFFLFGEKITYSLSEIQSTWVQTFDPFVLRQFIGNSDFGWKVAWSDRMVTMYTSILLSAWIWRVFHSRIKKLPFWGLLLLILPLAIDGTTHFVSDFSGIGQGFRDSNVWLVELTNDAFTPMFYAGDALVSFNSWMRIVTGILFGLGIALFSMPIIKEFVDIAGRTSMIEMRKAELRRKIIEK